MLAAVTLSLYAFALLRDGPTVVRDRMTKHRELVAAMTPPKGRYAIYLAIWVVGAIALVVYFQYHPLH